MTRIIPKTPAGLTPLVIALLALLAFAGACAVVLVLAARGESTSSAAQSAIASAGPTSLPTPSGRPGPTSVPTPSGRPGPVLRDLAYARHSPAQKLDLHLPAAGGTPHPVILYIHGGGFHVGDKARGHLAPIRDAALRRGYAVASINYRLTHEASFPAQINDVKAAIRWLRARASRYDLDPTRIAAWGGSAGGNLAALAGTSGGVAKLAGRHRGNRRQSDRVQAVVDWYGPISFLRTNADVRAAGFGPGGSRRPGSYMSRYLGAALPTVPGRARAADPTTYISADDPPFFVEHGTADGTVPLRQSIRFAAALEKKLGPDKVTLKILPGARHVGAPFFTPRNIALVLDWLDAQLRRYSN